VVASICSSRPQTFDFIFRGLWAESGGNAGRRDGVGQRRLKSEPLLKFSSEPLTDALTRLNKYSNNLMTRNLFSDAGRGKGMARRRRRKKARVRCATC